MLTNELTHTPTILSEPEYVPAKVVNNTKFDEANISRFTVNDRTLNISTARQMAHYHVNMAAMLLLSKWFDYLRENGVYDNTRIILAADHGYRIYNNQWQLDDLRLDNGYNLDRFFPLLMVKDFNSKGFTTSEEFMTNADVPTLATMDLFNTPENPMTGKKINSSEKFAPNHYVVGDGDSHIETNNGNTFLPSDWYKLHGSDIWDKNSWSLAAEDAVLPFDEEISN